MKSGEQKMKKIVTIAVIQTTLLLLVALPSTVLQAQDCNSAISRTAPDSRYQDHGDGTVSDKLTGLMWMQCSIGQSGKGCTSGEVAKFTWNAALQQAETLNSQGGFAGYSDWRLPNIKELRSLRELACRDSAINLKYFPNTPGNYYWSSSPATTSDSAWHVYFGDSTSMRGGRDYLLYLVRLVRGGQ